MNNNMSHLFNSIVDWDKAAEWLSKTATGTIPIFMLDSNLKKGIQR